MDSERKEFEEFFLSVDDGDFTEIDDEGFYVDHGTQRAWRAWQARAEQGCAV